MSPNPERASELVESSSFMRWRAHLPPLLPLPPFVYPSQLYSELLLARFALLENSPATEPDEGIKEAVCSLIFAAPRTEVRGELDEVPFLSFPRFLFPLCFVLRLSIRREDAADSCPRAFTSLRAPNPTRYPRSSSELSFPSLRFVASSPSLACSSR